LTGVAGRLLASVEFEVGEPSLLDGHDVQVRCS
jgi:hypothetical protein